MVSPTPLAALTTAVTSYRLPTTQQVQARYLGHSSAARCRLQQMAQVQPNVYALTHECPTVLVPLRICWTRGMLCRRRGHCCWTLRNNGVSKFKVDYAGKITATSISCSPTISSGTSAPATTPTKVGDMFVDTTGKKIYVATGVSSSGDWTILN
jgi:hypothetical protein